MTLLLKTLLAFPVAALGMAVCEELLLRSRWGRGIWSFAEGPRRRSHAVRAGVLLFFTGFGRWVESDLPAPVGAFFLSVIWMIWYEETYGPYRWFRMAGWVAGGLAILWY
jgi:hypothetical protein